MANGGRELGLLIFRVLQQAVRLWLQAQAFAQAGALAFYTLFSLAPVVIIIVTLVGFFLGSDAAEGRIAEQLSEAIGKDAAEAVQTAVQNSRIEVAGILPTVIGLVAMLIGATTVFAQMQAALNGIWEVAPRPSRSSIFVLLKARLLSLTIVLSIGFILLVSLLLSVAVRAVLVFAADWMPVHNSVVYVIEILVSLTVITLLFATIFKVLPDVVLGWRDVMGGALVTALLFGLGRTAIASYLAYTAPASTYGAAGSLVMLLLWVYYSSLILLFGAAVTRAWMEARGLPIRPRNSAVTVHLEFDDDLPDKPEGQAQ